jgi:pimeloyl-ACP methyl ester carboxylesterase
MSLTLEPPKVDVAKPVRRRGRWQRGLFCLATFCVAPFGWFLPRRFFRCVTEERLEQGLVLILPGIEGLSFLNLSILNGLVDAGVPYAMEIVDWTTGNKFLTLYHLRAWRRNRHVARQLADRIVQYQHDFPGRPVWIVGHSGGAGMALLTAASLPESRRLAGLILLAAAVSPRFDLSAARQKVERGIWSFHSWLDFLFVGVGTTIFGTFDGWHMPAAGMIGFRHRRDSERQMPTDDAPPFVQTAYHPRLLKSFHWGGHFSCTHRVFVAEHIAPVIGADAAEP